LAPLLSFSRETKAKAIGRCAIHPQPALETSSRLLRSALPTCAYGFTAIASASLSLRIAWLRQKQGEAKKKLRKPFAKFLPSLGYALLLLGMA